MRCCIVRHGETPWNADRRLQGHQDIPLNDLGLAQAEAAGQYLLRQHQQTPFAAVVSSDLLRAYQTAEAVAQALDMPVQSKSALRERHYGLFEGKTPAEASAYDPVAYGVLVERADLSAAPGAAEPLQAMLERIEHCLLDARFRPKPPLSSANPVLRPQYRASSVRHWGWAHLSGLSKHAP